MWCVQLQIRRSTPPSSKQNQKIQVIMKLFLTLWGSMRCTFFPWHVHVKIRGYNAVLYVTSRGEIVSFYSRVKQTCERECSKSRSFARSLFFPLCIRVEAKNRAKNSDLYVCVLCRKQVLILLWAGGIEKRKTAEAKSRVNEKTERLNG